MRSMKPEERAQNHLGGIKTNFCCILSGGVEDLYRFGNALHYKHNKGGVQRNGSRKMEGRRGQRSESFWKNQEDVG